MGSCSLTLRFLLDGTGARAWFLLVAAWEGAGARLTAAEGAGARAFTGDALRALRALLLGLGSADVEPTLESTESAIKHTVEKATDRILCDSGWSSGQGVGGRGQGTRRTMSEPLGAIAGQKRETLHARGGLLLRIMTARR